MTQQPDYDRTLAHIRECMDLCERAITREEVEAARLLLKSYVDSLTPVQQYQLLAGHMEVTR